MVSCFTTCPGVVPSYKANEVQLHYVVADVRSCRESALRNPPRRHVTNVHEAARIPSASTVRVVSRSFLFYATKDLLRNAVVHSRESIFRRYNCSDCAWAGRYPHLNASFLQDQPWLPKYWRLENNTYCDISYEGFDNRPLIDGNFDRATFGFERDNTNSTECLA